MNIIQIQDRLKGVTDQALVSYVENPTGDVPTYLALGELGRREEMRKKYQAQPQSTETVAEEIVSKAQGLGSIAPMGMTPKLPPQEETMSESITETGVATLPAPNIGQNYAGGGIIGYDVGGTIDPYAAARRQFEADRAKGFQRRNRDFMKFAEEYNRDNNLPMAPQPAQESLTTSVTDIIDAAAPASISEEMQTKVVEEKQRPIVDKARDALKTDLKNEEQLALNRTPKPKVKKQEQPETTTPTKGMTEYVDEFRSLLGEDTARTKMQERMDKLDARMAKKQDDAVYDAMINAGLSMAAGKDPNAFVNIAQGAMKGINTYEAALDAQDKLDEKQLELQMKMAQADRAEKIAAVEYGMQSTQFKETQDLKQAIANQEAVLAQVKLDIETNLEINKQNQTGMKNRGEIVKDIIEQEGTELEAFTQDWFEANGREYDLKDPQFKVAYENELNRRVNLRQSGVGGLDSSRLSQFNVVR